MCDLLFCIADLLLIISIFCIIFSKLGIALSKYKIYDIKTFCGDNWFFNDVTYLLPKQRDYIRHKIYNTEKCQFVLLSKIPWNSDHTHTLRNPGDRIRSKYQYQC